MKKDYNLTLEQAVRQTTEFLKNSRRRQRVHRLIVLIAPVIACLFTYVKPAGIWLHGQVSPNTALIVTLVLQIPVLSLLLYASFRFTALELPIRMAVKILEKQPKETWGKRTLDVSRGEITLGRDLTRQSFKVDFITDVFETDSASHCLHGRRVCMSIPKSVCSPDEIRKALADASR